MGDSHFDEIYEKLGEIHKKIKDIPKKDVEGNKYSEVESIFENFDFIYNSIENILKIIKLEKVDLNENNVLDYKLNIIDQKLNIINNKGEISVDDVNNIKFLYLNIYDVIIGIYCESIINVYSYKINNISKSINEKQDDVNKFNENSNKIKEIISFFNNLEGDDSAIYNKIKDIKENVDSWVDDASSLVNKLKEHERGANLILDKADKAFTAATQQGLAKAFSDQSRAQGRVMWVWIVALLTTLSFGSFVGLSHFSDIKEALLSAETSEGRLAMLLLIYALPQAGVVWFAWLATKQIGQRFRLAQDYTFKAAAASAYEGFRRQVGEIDKNLGGNKLEHALMLSALSRFDEQPLRLIEGAAHSSPWHDLLEKVLGSTGGVLDKASDLTEKAAGALGGAVDAVKNVKDKLGDAGAGDKS